MVHRAGITCQSYGPGWFLPWFSINVSVLRTSKPKTEGLRMLRFAVDLTGGSE